VIDEIDEKLLEYIRSNGPCTRKEMTAATGIAWTTAYDHLKRLVSGGMVTKNSVRSGKRGRPRVYYQIGSI